MRVPHGREGAGDIIHLLNGFVQLSARNLHCGYMLKVMLHPQCSGYNLDQLNHDLLGRAETSAIFRLPQVTSCVAKVVYVDHRFNVPATILIFLNRHYDYKALCMVFTFGFHQVASWVILH